MNKKKTKQLLFERMNIIGGMPLNESYSTNDPTKEEMYSFLKNKYGGFEFDDFSAEEAIYWFAYDYHGGQNSNLYSVLSTSEFKPSRLHSGIENTDDELSKYMYDSLVDYYEGAKVEENQIKEDINEKEIIPLNDDLIEPFFNNPKYNWVKRLNSSEFNKIYLYNNGRNEYLIVLIYNHILYNTSITKEEYDSLKN